MLLQPITVQFSKSTLKPSVYTLTYAWMIVERVLCFTFIFCFNSKNAQKL